MFATNRIFDTVNIYIIGLHFPGNGSRGRELGDGHRWGRDHKKDEEFREEGAHKGRLSGRKCRRNGDFFEFGILKVNQNDKLHYSYF